MSADDREKQSGPISRILFPRLVTKTGAAAIYLGRTVARRLLHPTRSVELRRPPREAAWFRRVLARRAASRRGPGPRARCLRGLAGGGVYPAIPVTRDAVRSYRTFSPLPVDRSHGPIGGVFSVALSLARRSGPVAVSHHRALSSSDFPPGVRRPQAVAWPALLRRTFYLETECNSISQTRERGRPAMTDRPHRCSNQSGRVQGGAAPIRAFLAPLWRCV